MLDIDRKNDWFTDDGGCALHYAILSNNPKMVELLLEEYHANPNVVDGNNSTTLMMWALLKDRNLSTLRLLVKYGFDFVKLINQRSNKSRGLTEFLELCRTRDGNTHHNIDCLKHLFSICEKISNCSINTLARDHSGTSGLHLAIFARDVDMSNIC